ncbi:MAG: ParB/RepB/Spo0J family partition protein [Lachnospiraceae bacterium]|nr:ParB/RepB/Spo0J family partition protein [Lachnospiraceae bacterium]
MEQFQDVKISELNVFRGYPFRVEHDRALVELSQSIEENGVLVPLILRKNPYGNGYDIISGHRRVEACKLLGKKNVPAFILELDDTEAIITMVDSNLYREDIKPSEKAFAYKMKLDAVKQQGKRTDLTSCQVGKKFDVNPTVKWFKPACNNRDDGNLLITDAKKIDSNQQLARQVGESKRQIARYIRLTYLVPKILSMVDEQKIAFTVGVELSYLSEEEQYELYAVMDLEQATPSLSQANRLKIKSQQGELDMDLIYEILGERKPNQKEQLKIPVENLKKYFPADYTPRQQVELIERLVKEWHDKQPI